MTTVTLTQGHRSIEVPPALFRRIELRCLHALAQAAEVALAEQRHPHDIADMAIAALTRQIADAELTPKGRTVASAIHEAVIRSEHRQLLSQLAQQLLADQRSTPDRSSAQIPPQPAAWDGRSS